MFVAEGYRKEINKITQTETSINGSRFHVENEGKSNEQVDDGDRESKYRFMYIERIHSFLRLT